MQVFRDYRLIECETTMRRLTPIAIREVAVFDTEDVAPVIHAHWEYRYDTGIYQTEFLCSRCKELIEIYSCTVDEVEYEYCPHCGAKMDEEVE